MRKVICIIIYLIILIPAQQSNAIFECDRNIQRIATFPVPLEAKNIIGKYDGVRMYLVFKLDETAFNKWMTNCSFTKYTEEIRAPIGVVDLVYGKEDKEVKEIIKQVTRGCFWSWTSETYGGNIVYDKIAHKVYVNFSSPMLTGFGCQRRADYFFIPNSAKNALIKKDESLTHIVFDLDEKQYKAWLKESGFIFDTKTIKRPLTVENFVQKKDKGITCFCKEKIVIKKGYECFWNYDEDDRGSIIYDAINKRVYVEFAGTVWGNPFPDDCLRKIDEDALTH